MNMSTFLIVLVIAVITYFAIRSLRSNENCADCASAGYCAPGATCKWTKDIKKAERDLAREKKRELRRNRA